MIHHVSEDLLDRFVEGTLDVRVAIAVAQHIDECSRCASRAAVADPMAKAFASVKDREPPMDLVDGILLAVGEDSKGRMPGVQELAAAAALLICASGLLAFGGAPAGLAADAAVAMKALGTGSGVLMGQLYMAPLGWSALASALGLCGSVFLVRQLGGWSRSPR